MKLSSRGRLILPLFSWLALAALPGAASADTIHLENGDVITGTVKSFSAKTIVVKTEYAGDVSIDATKVTSFDSGEILDVELADGTELTGKIVSTPEGALQVQPEEGAPVPFELAQVQGAAPPLAWFRYKGEANVGLFAATGNTKTTSLHLDGKIATHFGLNTVTLSGQLNRETAKVDTKVVDQDGNEVGTQSERETTASNWKIMAQYDRSLSDTFYVYLNNGYENDDLRDLNLRISVGPGVGYKIFDIPSRLLSIELGPSYVHENYKFDEDDRDYASARWALDFEQALFVDWARFYHNHELLESLQDAKQLIITTATGLKVDLMAHVTAGGEIQFDYNNDPADENKKEDTRYILKIGYTF